MQRQQSICKNCVTPSAHRYSGSMSPDLTSLQSAYLKLATLVLHDEVYLPVFERIEREIAVLQQKDDVIARARAVAALHKAVS